MEFWDILDETGKKIYRAPVKPPMSLKPGEYHLTVHVWVKNDKGEFLIQRRADSREILPGVWAATTGSALSGETSANAAVRELYEELGVKAVPEQLKFKKRFLRETSIADLWVMQANIPLTRLVLQREEVAQAKWVDAKELRFMLAQGVFFDYGKEYFDVVFGL